MSSDDDDKDSKYGVGREILIAAIFSLLAVVVFIIILRTYARYLSRSQERTRRDILNRVSTLAQIASVDMDSVDPPAETAGGLDPFVIASLPKFTYKPAANSLDQSEVIECSVCLSSIEEETMVRLLPNCKHMFHVECIDVWLNSNKTCPVCRTVADPKVQPERNDKGTIFGVQRPTAPPIENSIPHGAAELDQKAGGSGSGSRLSSFRRMLSRGRSSRRIQSCEDHEVGSEDLERQ
ncbi:RING-H2 finger protein ATL40-like [Juglans microcarpa x Juglans regia]|uniref:RING-H2 finger protein ATL40-like n=1 Tax=Juglans microcarpa x Juglans regia TaxID=2249226 RepID=UPI001B7E0D9F|nr:RING-H2 finger protein ATL40-like [Juglans microcarpa x Juglans regia]